MRQGQFAIYNDEVGIINRIFRLDDGTGAIEFHYVMPDGTTRMKLNENNPDRVFPETDSVNIRTDDWAKIETLSPYDERIPENRRAVRNT